MVIKVVGLAMLKDKDAVFLKHTLCENQIRNRPQFRQLIRRIGEDEIKSFPAPIPDIAENIAADRKTDIRSELL